MIRKKGGKSLPKISTASLPDIVFMLLFFFMVVTVMRDTDQMVEVSYPKATELQKLEKKSLVSHLSVGPPTAKWQTKFGTAPRIQLNDRIATDVKEVRTFIQNERGKLKEALQGKMTTSLKVDEGVKMGIISEIKTELRKASALKINYSARTNEELSDQ